MHEYLLDLIKIIKINLAVKNFILFLQKNQAQELEDLIKTLNK